MTAATAEEIVDLLIDGARYGDLEDIREALQLGAPVDSTDEQGRTGARWATVPTPYTGLSLAVLCSRSPPYGLRQRPC